ncbi:MAG TPA: hypothetical protein VGF99_11745 [Myxococcota bacterium]
MSDAESYSTSSADLAVMLRVGLEDHPAQVVDISFYSVTLRSPLIVPVGSFLPLRFRLSSGDEIALHGIVSQVRPRLRVRFEGLSARQFDELSALVAEVRKRGGESTQPLIDADAISGEADIRSQIKSLSAEVARLREHVTHASSSPPAPARSRRGRAQESTTPTVVALLTAIDPMLWGLEEAVKYFATTAPSTPERELHLRHLHLLQKLLARLNDEILDSDV